MKEPNNIDDLFKKKLENTAVPFDNAALESFSSYLSTQEKRKRRGVIILIALLICLISVPFFILNNRKTNVYSKKSKTKTELNTKEVQVIEQRSTPQNSTYKSQSKKFKQSTKQGATELNNPHNFAETTNTEINQSRFSKAVVYESSKSINNNESIDENDQVIPITKDDNVDKTYYNNLSFINPNLNLENAAYEPEFIDGEKMKNKYTSLELVFGVGLAPGFGKTKTYSGIDLSPIIGLNYVKRLDRTFSFECALLYNYRGKIEQDHKEQSQIKLAEKLHIFNVPAYFNYRSDRHNYLIGAQLSYIPAQSSTITINNTNQFWDKNVGYTHFDGALSLGYEYVVSETLNIGTRINLGLFDYTDEAIFTGNNRHQDLQFRIQIDHKLK